jgi:hypothetical protein
MPEMVASQNARLLRRQQRAAFRAARPDPVRSLALSQGRLFAAQNTLAQDDKQTASQSLTRGYFGV